MTRSHRKLNVSLPAPLVENLDTLCLRMNITRSALLTSLLEEPVQNLCALVEGVIATASLDPAEQVRRFRGDSKAIIRERVADLQSQLGEDSD